MLRMRLPENSIVFSYQWERLSHSCKFLGDSMNNPYLPTWKPSSILAAVLVLPGFTQEVELSFSLDCPLVSRIEAI